jgi:hypothetical protein
MAVAFASPTFAAVYTVGPSQTYSTIQDAINAAAGADVGSSGDNDPNPDPVDIVVYAGTYTENLVVPTDATNKFNGKNDGWTIRANTGDNVLLKGKIDFGVDRDNGVLRGIDIDWTGQNYAISFSQTARNTLVENALIYGGTAGGHPAISGANFYGSNNLNHVTIYGADYGVSVGYASSLNMTNSIVAFSVNSAFYSSNGSSISYSDFYGNNPNFTSGNVDGGNNLNYPTGLDPMFVSTNPLDPHFLWLQQGSPASGAASDSGNMGARPTLVPEPTVLGVLCLGGMFLAGRRRRL